MKPKPGSNAYGRKIISERIAGCKTGEEKIEAYIRKMECSPFDPQNPANSGYECCGKILLYQITEGAFDGFKDFEKTLNRVIRRLRKEGLEIDRSGGFIQRNG